MVNFLNTFVLLRPQKLTFSYLRKKIPYIGHVFFWLVYILYAYVVNVIVTPEVTSLFNTICSNLLTIWVFYSCYYFWRISLEQKNWFKSGVVLITSMLVFYLGRSLFLYIILPMNGVKPYTPFNSRSFNIHNIIMFIQYSIYSVGYYFSVRSSLKEKLLRKTIEEKQKVEEARFQLEQHNDTLEKQQLQTEYAFLRSQINPHFLQNTLNFFYSKSLTCSEELSSAILTLSEIMRYSLNTKTNEPPPLLTEEVKQMNNVITINQMRFGNRLQIKFNQTGELEGIRIIPLVLITLVENAFKHGELGNADHPMTINLDISEYQESMRFSITNLKKTGPKDRSHGIGLENIRRRLQLVYGDDASLNIIDTPATYTITLLIKKLHP
jgi:two-component system, LytTR family, sensor kinase